MAESKNSGDTTLTVAPTKTLTLKRPVEAGTVRQSFSHGRTKTVVVEKVKRRALGPGEAHRARPRRRAAHAGASAANTGAPHTELRSVPRRRGRRRALFCVH